MYIEVLLSWYTPDFSGGMLRVALHAICDLTYSKRCNRIMTSESGIVLLMFYVVCLPVNQCLVLTSHKSLSSFLEC